MLWGVLPTLEDAINKIYKKDEFLLTISRSYSNLY
jgi:hypothetical protein